jgi:hypothetical protein
MLRYIWAIALAAQAPVPPEALADRSLALRDSISRGLHAERPPEEDAADRFVVWMRACEQWQQRAVQDKILAGRKVYPFELPDRYCAVKWIERPLRLAKAAGVSKDSLRVLERALRDYINAKHKP